MHLFIRQNQGTLPKKRRTGEFRKLDGKEFTQPEEIVGNAFDAAGPRIENVKKPSEKYS